MAGDGSGNPRAQSRKILIPNGILIIGAGLVDDLAEHPFQACTLQPHRRRLHRQSLRPKGLYFKAVPLQLLGNAREYHHMVRPQLHQQWHQQPLPLHALHLPVAQDLLKKHPFVCNVLVDDP